MTQTLKEIWEEEKAVSGFSSICDFCSEELGLKSTRKFMAMLREIGIASKKAETTCSSLITKSRLLKMGVFRSAPNYYKPSKFDTGYSHLDREDKLYYVYTYQWFIHPDYFGFLSGLFKDFDPKSKESINKAKDKLKELLKRG